jgi:hypothetical protein
VSSISHLLKLLVELAGRTRDKNPAWNSALTVFDALYDASGLAALRTISALGSVHHFFAVGSFCDFGHLLSQYQDFECGLAANL